MPSSPENREQRLERLVQKTLGDLPLRPAPASLTQRVLAELERRAALPWWRRSYAHWPLPARCAFLLGSAAVLKAVVMLAVWAMVGFETGPFNEAFASSAAWVGASADFISSIVEFCGAVLSGVPRFWLYLGGICLAAMYATLAGLGAFAYRWFHGKHSFLSQ